MNSVQNVDTTDLDSRPPRQRRQRAIKGRAKGVKPEERGKRTSGKILRMLYGQSYGLIFELIEDALTGPRAVRVSRAA